MQRRHTASLAVAGALATALTQVAGVGAAGAASADRGLGYGDFPTVRALSGVIPGLADGHRHRHALGEAQRFAHSCVATRNVTPRTTSSRKMIYLDKAGHDPYLSGKVAPIVAVYRYRSAAEAARALDEIRAAYTRCVGTHANSGVSEKITPLSVPALGQDRVGFRTATSVPHGVTDQVAIIVVRRGTHLVETDLIRRTVAPSAKRAVKVARLATRAVG